MSIPLRLERLRDLARQSRCDDNTVMTDAEIDELFDLERRLEAEKAGIRAEARQEAEQHRQSERRPARAASAYSHRPSSRLSGAELIARGLANQ